MGLVARRSDFVASAQPDQRLFTRSMGSIITKLVTCQLSMCLPVSVAEHAGLSLPCTQILGRIVFLGPDFLKIVFLSYIYDVHIAVQICIISDRRTDNHLAS